MFQPPDNCILHNSISTALWQPYDTMHVLCPVLDLPPTKLMIIQTFYTCTCAGIVNLDILDVSVMVNLQFESLWRLF